MAEENLEPESSDDSDNSNVSENQQPTESSASQAGWSNLSADDQKFVENKGWKSPLDALKSYHELEKSAGTRIALPKADDKEAVGKLLRQLGAPEDINGYEINNVRDADVPFMDGFKSAAKELNILPAQAEGIYAWFRSAQDEMSDKFNQQVEKDKEEIKAEWGVDYSKNEELMTRGLRTLGLEQEALENVEMSIGTKAFMKLGKRIGDMISEDNARGIGGGATKSEEMSTEEYFKKFVFAQTNEGN